VPPRIGTRGWRWWLGAVVVLALGLRLGLALAPPVVLWGDPSDYQRHAVSIAHTGSYPPTELASPSTPSSFRPPAYPFLLGAVYAAIGVHPLAGRVLGAILGAVCVWLIGLLGAALWNRRTGLLAAALSAVFLPLIALNGSLLSESLLLPLEAAFALALGMCVRRPAGIRWALAAGAICGLAALTRAVADAWVVIGVLVAVLAATGARARLQRALAVLVAFLVVISPWLIRDAVVFHQFVPITTEGGFTAAGQYNALAGQDDAFEAVYRAPTSQVPAIHRQVQRLLNRPGGLNEAQLDGVLRSDALRYLRAHPVHLGVAVGLDTLRLFDLGRGHTFTTGIVYHELNLPSWLRRPTTILAQLAALLALTTLLVSLVRWRRGGRPRVPVGPWWLWAIPLMALALTVPTVGNQLKLAPLDPVLLLVTAAGIEAVLVTVLPVRGRVARQRTQRARSNADGRATS
jgi:4-amino-4-deoxy-L-arabinose transferase-like glycosyltransferase